MKQQLLALAIGATLAATALPSVAAEAKGPEIYGTLYVTLDYVNPEGKANSWELNSNNSNLGIKHEIALNQGVSAVMKAEFEIQTDDGKADGTSPFKQRDIYAGVKGKYGQVIAGRFSTPLRNTEGKIDAFNNLHGDIDAVLGGQVRLNNLVQYSSPVFGNTQIHIAFAPGEKADVDGDGNKDDNNNIADSYSAAAVYTQSNLYLAAGLDINGDASTGTDVFKATAAAPEKNIARSDRLQLAGKYQFGAASVGAILQHARDSDDSSLKENAVVVNSTYKINAYTLKAQYGLNQGHSTDNELRLAAVGADYQLSAAAFVTLDYAVVTEAPKVGPNEDEKILSLGYNLKF